MISNYDIEALRVLNPGWRPKLIGFCGLAGSGKTFAATHLARNYGYSRVRFAGPLKEMMRALGLTAEEVDGALKERPCALLGGKTPRWAMQTLGTEWGRDLIDSDLWINAWDQSVAKFLDAGDPVVVDDVRFANEAAAIWKRGGILVRLDRGGAGSASGAGHASERIDFPFDVRIENAGGAAFCAALDLIVRKAATG